MHLDQVRLRNLLIDWQVRVVLMVPVFKVMGKVVSYPDQVFGYIYVEGEVAKATTSGVELN